MFEANECLRLGPLFHDLPSVTWTNILGPNPMDSSLYCNLISVVHWNCVKQTRETATLGVVPLARLSVPSRVGALMSAPKSTGFNHE